MCAQLIRNPTDYVSQRQRDRSRLHTREPGKAIPSGPKNFSVRTRLADGVDVRIIQLMLWHASIQQTQRYLNVTEEELRPGLEVCWNNKGRPLRLASGS